MNKKFFSMLSIAMKAGKVKSGELSCEKALQKGEAFLVIIATDASQNTQSKFINKTFYYNVPNIVTGDKESLGKTIGKQIRTVLAITDENIAKKLIELSEN